MIRTHTLPEGIWTPSRVDAGYPIIEVKSQNSVPSEISFDTNSSQEIRPMNWLVDYNKKIHIGDIVPCTK